MEDVSSRPDDFPSALAAVSGMAVDLRGAANPPGGFLMLGVPGREHWHSFSAFGTELFSVDLNTVALDAWATAIDTIETLSTFEQRLAAIYWESNQTLLNAVAIGANCISRNVQIYLSQAGLVPGSPQYRTRAADPVAAVAEARSVIGRYSSSVGGGLPVGIAPIAGDLGGPAVWAAANAVITQLISRELDKMDQAVRSLAVGQH
jgi:hypothetical protein